MEILKRGKLKAERKKFTCPYCGSVFIADSGEYGHKSHIDRGEYVEQYWCKCPVCNNQVEKWIDSNKDV